MPEQMPRKSLQPPRQALIVFYLERIQAQRKQHQGQIDDVLCVVMFAQVGDDPIDHLPPVFFQNPMGAAEAYIVFLIFAQGHGASSRAMARFRK